MDFADTLFVIASGAIFYLIGHVVGDIHGRKLSAEKETAAFHRGHTMAEKAFRNAGLMRPCPTVRIGTEIDRLILQGSEGPVAKTTFRPRKEPNWHAVERAFDIPGAGQFDPVGPILTLGDPLVPKPGDRRIVEITTVTPHLFRVDRFNGAYEKSDSVHKRIIHVPARWWPYPIGRYENGLFLSEADARSACAGPFVLHEFKAEDLKSGH